MILQNQRKPETYLIFNTPLLSPEEEASKLGLNWDILELLSVLENGNIGIGNPNPEYKLSVDGIIESTYGGFRFPDGTVQTTASPGGPLKGLLDSKGNSDWKLTLRRAMRLLSATMPASPKFGDIYNDGTNLFYYNGTEWDDLASRATTLVLPWSLNGTHIYNNNTGSVLINTSTADPGFKICCKK